MQGLHVSCTPDIYPGIENLILQVPRLSYPGCHVRATLHWLYWNSRTWSSSDVIVMFVTLSCAIAS